MKLNSAQVEQTLTQLKAQVIPDDHPIVSNLNELFGHHTYFVDGNGLNVVEPSDNNHAGAPLGKVINLAGWSDAHMTSLTLHDPEPTEIVVVFENEH